MSASARDLVRRAGGTPPRTPGVWSNMIGMEMVVKISGQSGHLHLEMEMDEAGLFTPLPPWPPVAPLSRDMLTGSCTNFLKFRETFPKVPGNS